MPLHITEPASHIALITIDNQAKRNAMSRADLETLGATWDQLETDDACRCIVLTGSGEKAFCAGADIGGDLSAGKDIAQMINRALLKTSSYTKPIISAVNGDCAGGGVELLLASDIRIAAEHARFGLPEVKWSIYPFGGATVKLTQQIGYVHAMDLILTGRLIDAESAARINLVNRVTTPTNVLNDAMETARSIAANSPSAVQAVKQQISSGIAEFAQSREATDQQLGDQVRATRYFTEGVAAFREKRQPNYD
ncbi:MAG: enoyl-CoA hydratase/isomerase family protein [Hyphomicrobiaceae bacterium]